MPFYSPLLGRQNMNLRFKQKTNSFTSSMPLLPTKTSTNINIKNNTNISNKTRTKSSSNCPGTNQGSHLSRKSSTSCSILPLSSNIGGNHVSTKSSNRYLLSTNTSGLDSWNLSRSMESLPSEAESQKAIRRGVGRLVLLANRCERVNSSLEQVVTENHKIRDNSFPTQQVNFFNIPYSFLRDEKTLKHTEILDCKLP